MTLSANPVAGYLVWAVVSVGLLWATWRIYRPRVRSLAPLWRRTLLALRLMATLALIGLLLRPSIILEEPDERPRRLLLLADSSRSMTVGDGPEGQTRREEIVSLIGRSTDRLAGSEQLDVRLYDFDTSLRPTESFGSDADGDWTDLAASLDELTRQNRDGRIASAVVLSDGAVRTATPSSELVAAAAQTFAEETGAAITPVAIGSTTLAVEGVDLVVEDVLVAPTTFEKKAVPVRAKIRLQNFDGRAANVRLLLEPLSREGELIEVSPAPGTQPAVSITGEGLTTTATIDLSFRATVSGEFKLRVAVDPADDEIQTANNVRDALLTVRKGGLRVLYLDSARWEPKFIRRVNATSQIQLDYVFVPDLEALIEAESAGQWFSDDRYDVFLIGDIPIEAVEANRRGSIGEQLSAAIRRGAGVGVIAGPRIAERRPRGPFAVAMPGRFESDEPIATDDGARLTPTPEGLSHFVMRLGGPEVFETLPPLERVFPIQPTNEVVDVLAETPNGQPLVLVAEAGRGRTMLVAMSDTWLWYRAGQAAVHQRFWQQSLLWLGRKEEEADAGLQLAVSPRQVDRGETVATEARYESESSGAGGTLRLRLTRPDGTTDVLKEGGSEAGFAMAVESTEQAGDYTLTLERILDGEAVESLDRRFVVNASDPELDRPATDLATLDRVAAASGGTVLTPERFDDWLGELLESLKAGDASRQRLVTLWDGWPPLLVFLMLAATEWTVRKSRGLV